MVTVDISGVSKHRQPELAAIAARANELVADLGGKLAWTMLCRDMSTRANFDYTVRMACIETMRIDAGEDARHQRGCSKRGRCFRYR